MYTHFENLDITQFFHTISTSSTVGIVVPIVVYLLFMLFDERK